MILPNWNLAAIAILIGKSSLKECGMITLKCLERISATAEDSSSKI